MQSMEESSSGYSIRDGDYLMPQYDVLTGKTLDLEALRMEMDKALRAKEWRKAEHYATLIVMELGEIATREELGAIPP